MYPYLCGGTYFTLILQSRRRRADGGKYSEPDVFAGLLKIVDPYFEKPKGDSFGKTVSRYKNCSKRQPNISESLPFTNRRTRETFDARIRSEYRTSLRLCLNLRMNLLT